MIYIFICEFLICKHRLQPCLCIRETVYSPYSKVKRADMLSYTGVRDPLAHVVKS